MDDHDSSDAVDGLAGSPLDGLAPELRDMIYHCMLEPSSGTSDFDATFYGTPVKQVFDLSTGSDKIVTDSSALVNLSATCRQLHTEVKAATSRLNVFKLPLSLLKVANHTMLRQWAQSIAGQANVTINFTFPACGYKEGRNRTFDPYWIGDILMQLDIISVTAAEVAFLNGLNITCYACMEVKGFKYRGDQREVEFALQVPLQNLAGDEFLVRLNEIVDVELDEVKAEGRADMASVHRRAMKRRLLKRLREAGPGSWEV